MSTKTLGQLAFSTFEARAPKGTPRMDILGDRWDCLTREEKDRWEAVGNVVRGAAIEEFLRQAVGRIKPRATNTQRLPDGAILTYERELEMATCDQCANPDLKGIHTCGRD